MSHLHSWRAALLCALFAVFAVIGLTPANAADTSASTDIVIPWGAWLSSILVSITSAAVGYVAWAVRKWAPWYVNTVVSDAAIDNAVHSALAKVEGAVAGQSLSLEVTNSVARDALNYIVQSEPRVAKYLGSKLGPVILSKLSEIGSAPKDAVPVPRVFGVEVSKKGS